MWREPNEVESTDDFASQAAREALVSDLTPIDYGKFWYPPKVRLCSQANLGNKIWLTRVTTNKTCGQVEAEPPLASHVQRLVDA